MRQAPCPEQIIPAGYCISCRGCCRFHERQGPWLPHLLDSEQELAHCVTAVEAGKGEAAPYRCVSLDAAGGSCAVYRSRPFECRLYPFVLALRDGAFFLAVDTNCPFVREQENSAGFSSYAGRLAGWLQEPGVRDVLAANAHVFQPYAGVRYITELKL